MTQEELKKTFAELTRQRDRIRELSSPLRADRDRAKNIATIKIQALDGAIKEVEEGLFNIELRLSQVAKQLGAYRISKA